MGRGVIPGGHPLLVTKARGPALGGADLVVVAGTPLDFRLGYGVFGGKDGATPARVVHLADSPGQVSRHADLAAGRPATSPSSSTGCRRARPVRPQPDWSAVGRAACRTPCRPAAERDAALLGAEADPIHPARIYGELVPRLAEDAVVIGDGGDFVSFAGKFVEPKRPGGWLDPGPYGCLGAGLGAAIAARIARPSAQVVLLFGDGAAGFSLMDVDTLVRHNLPVVMVCGNNSAWGLEKGPMQMLYGYDVAADLAPQTRYDEVVKALGGAGETVTDPQQIGPALDRAFAAGRALPGQRDHRRQRGLPPQHLRHLRRPRLVEPSVRRGARRVGELTVDGLRRRRLHRPGADDVPRQLATPRAAPRGRGLGRRRGATSCSAR